MSIEQSLERIAIALETLVGKQAGEAPVAPVAPVAAAPKKQKAEKPAATVETAPVDIIPGQEDESGVPESMPEAPEGATVLAVTGIKDTTQLRDFVQKCLEKAGAKANDLVTFIKGGVCAKFTPTEPKLVKIPAANIPTAAQMVYDWCIKNHIIVG